jgi:hypothetical protein
VEPEQPEVDGQIEEVDESEISESDSNTDICDEIFTNMSVKDLNPGEDKLYLALFKDIRSRYNLETAEDLMMLDRALYNYFIAARGGSYLKRMGMLITDNLKAGDVTKVNPVIQSISHADKRFMEFMDKLKLSRYKRDFGEMTEADKRDMKIIISRLKNVSSMKKSVEAGSSSYKIIECTPESEPENDGKEEGRD